MSMGNKKCRIIDLHAREILDSRGFPTVETEIKAMWEGSSEAIYARASVPSGASTGSFEAVELRDGEKRYQGLGVKKAVGYVNQEIWEKMIGKNVLEQGKIDALLQKLDGTDYKGHLGANAILSVSMACARLGAKAAGVPLYRYLGGVHAGELPTPMMNILNGGRHASNMLDFQEFMIVPALENGSFHEKMEVGEEVYHALKKLLEEKGLSTGVGDEGGFAPEINNTVDALDLLEAAVKKAGYTPGKEILFAIDAATSELYNERDEKYYFKGEEGFESENQDLKSQKNGSKNGVKRETNEMLDYYSEITERYPIISIEDGLAEEDWKGWQELTKRLGNKIKLVGDDLFVTNPKRLEAGIKLKAANAILIKLNQIGTVSEAMQAIEMAKKAGFRTIISHRSGETEDTFISDFAVAVNAGWIKTGAPCRGERIAKYNQLLRIEEDITREI